MVAVQVTSDPYVGQTATILSFIVSFTHLEETAQLQLSARQFLKLSWNEFQQLGLNLLPFEL